MKNIFIVIILIVLAGLVSPLISKNLSKEKGVITPLAPVQEANLPKLEQVKSGISLQQGYKLETFANNLGAPRDLEFSPEGILLASIPAQGKVVAINDKTTNVITGLDMPHGLAFYNGKLFIAERTRLARYNWDKDSLKATLDKVLFKIPYIGGHNTRTIVFNSKGDMFVSIGSSCNVCAENNPWLASVIVSNSEGENPRVFSKGLRNATFLALNPKTDEIWDTEMGRDNLGDDIPPEEINILKENGDYGWPYCFGDKIRDTSVPVGHDICPKTISPIFQIQAHSAPLGLTFVNSSQFPDNQGDLLVSFHGSWNRSVPTGYKVVLLKVAGNTISGQQDFLTFLDGGTVNGRPVDLIFDKNGALFVSDDKNGNVYKISRD